MNLSEFLFVPQSVIRVEAFFSISIATATVQLFGSGRAPPLLILALWIIESVARSTDIS